MSPCNTRFSLIAATTPASGAFRSAVLFYIDEGGASPNTGNFVPAGAQTITRGGGVQAFVTVGYDLNRTGALTWTGPNEYKMQCRAATLDFTASGTNGKRNSPAAIAESYYPVVSGEHFETGNPFNFKLVDGFTGPYSLIRYEVRRIGLTGSAIATGKAIECPYTFPVSSAGYDHYVRFYADCNDNGTHQANEPYYNSAIFSVQSVKTWTLVTKKTDHSYIVNVTLPHVQAWFDASAAVAMRKDHADDRRACVAFTLTNWGVVPVSPTNAPDPVASFQDADVHSMSTAPVREVTIVSHITAGGGAGGLAWYSHSPPRMILSWWERQVTDIPPVHEFLHALGLEPPNGLNNGNHSTDPTNMMYGAANPASVRLRADQRDTLD